MAKANQGFLTLDGSTGAGSLRFQSLFIISLIAILSAVLTYFFSSLIAPTALGFVLIMGVSLAWLMSRPIRIVQVLFILLPFHIILMVILFGLLGMPAGIVRSMASWKEAVLAFFIIAVLLGVVVTGKKRFQFDLTEIFALVFILQVSLYVFIGPILGSQVQIIGRLYGLRDSTMLLACYFLGRAIVLNAVELERLLKLILLIGTITVFLGLLEWLLLPDEFFVILGVSNYYKDFLGLEYAGDDWGQGLPANFWTYMGGLGYVRRSVSVYLTSQGYALTFLIMIPIATYFLLSRPKEGGRRWFWALIINALGLVSSITRVTIVVCTCLFFLMAKLTGRKGWAIKGVLVAIMIAFLAIIISEGVRTLVVETITFKSDSSIGHLSAWTGSLDPILKKPIFGYGLSEASQNARRFGGRMVGEESAHLRVLGELGSVGFLIYMGFWFSYILEALKIGRKGSSQSQINIFSVLGVAICVGFLINGIATDLLSSTYNNFAAGILLGLIRSTTKNISSSTLEKEV